MPDECPVDDCSELPPQLNRWTSAVIAAAIEVHRALGPDLQESTYENAMAIELELRGVPFARQVPIAVNYKGHIVGEARLDLLIADQIIELKAVESLVPLHKAQVIGYLKITKHKLALLINFNVPVLKDGIKRIAN